jgi:predicted RNA binding protein YcfA (HicA-like mRNA interferase family)
MSEWPATKARRALAALQRIGWRIVRISGSHRTLRREGWPQYRFAYHDKEELGPVALSELAKHTGLRPEDL